MRITLLKRLLVGPPMPLAQARHERLGKAVALAVFASDPLSSVAYATEEILLVLILAGSAALSYSLPVALGIAGLLAVVVISYRQTVVAYPQGGGAYLVAKDNLGIFPALTAAAALLVDYVLTVSVSVVAGVAALTSAVPQIHPYRVVLSILAVAGIAMGNLRGVRESGRMFAAPTYFFVVSILGMVGYGLVATALDLLPEAPYEPHPPGLEGLGLFLLLRSYAAGCTALTGVEAVSNGVQALKPPEGKNAQTVMTWLGVLSIAMFLGITYLAYDFGIAPGGDETVVSKIARRVFGTGVPYYCVQSATLLILVLAANTSYADFPRLSSILARDRFVPRQFANQGDRLVFSNGILILSGFAILLIVAFAGDTHALLPLYAIGVFISFTLSQSGMVRRWPRGRARRAVREDARADGHGARGLRGDGPRADGQGGGEVEQVGARRSAGRLDVAVPVALAAVSRLHRPDPGARRRADGHDRSAGIPPAAMVAALPAQPDGPSHQGGTSLPQEHGRRRRAVPAQALDDGG